jgi:hypothetical protein
VTLTAANFALTAAQSTADVANGAGLSISQAYASSASEFTYTNVKGRSYTSYNAFYTSSTCNVADDLNLSSASNEIDLLQNNVTITRGRNAENVTIGGSSFNLTYHANETIQAGHVGGETLKLSAGFGAETVKGLAESGTSPDTLDLSTAAFSYLNSGMTQAQDLAAVLRYAQVGTSGTTITDSYGDSLTVAGTPTTLTANLNSVKFV